MSEAISGGLGVFIPACRFAHAGYGRSLSSRRRGLGAFIPHVVLLMRAICLTSGTKDVDGRDKPGHDEGANH
jgi:hypothetical protein